MAKNNFRKRVLVTEGELLNLYFEVEQIRQAETKELYQAKFKALLKEANLVKLTVQKKEVANG